MIGLAKSRLGSSPVAVDAGHAGMRAVQLRRSLNRWHLVQAARLSESPDDVAGEQYTERLRRRLVACLGRAPFSGKRVKLALSAPDVAVHSLHLPDGIIAQGGASLNAVIREEIRRMLPEEATAIESAHWALPKPSVSAPNTIGVAVERSLVDQTLAAGRLAGIDCVSIDVATTALSRLATLIRPWQDKEVWGILDVGFRESRLILNVGDVPVLSRSVGVGSGEWTRLIAEDFGTTEKTAETQKCRHGLVLPAQRGEVADPAVAEVGSMIFSVLRAPLTELAREINRSYEYVLSCYGPRDAADLILVGGGAALASLPQFLGDALGIPVRRAGAYLDNGDCRLGVDTGMRRFVEELAIAIGLAVTE